MCFFLFPFFLLRRRAFAGVVGNVPSGALEFEGRGRKQALELAAAFFAFGEVGIRELPYLFKLRTTLPAPIFVKGQAILLFDLSLPL